METGKRKIRVLRLLSRINVGGPSFHVINLCKGMAGMGYETVLAVGNPQSVEGSMIDQAINNGIRVEVVKGLTGRISLFNDFKAFLGIVRLVIKYKPDIVHTHTTKVGILGRLAAVFCGVPVILHTFHGHIFSGYFSEKVSSAIACLERLLARFTDKIVTLSPDLKKEIAERLSPISKDKIAVIPLGLELEKFRRFERKKGNIRKSLGISPDAFLIGIVARLVPVKNHLRLIEVFGKVLERKPDAHLIIVGDGEMRQEIEGKIESLNLEQNVSMLGIRKDIEEVYSDLDLLVLLSKNEGTPVVLIEALAAGCPVAATSVGGVIDLLNGGAYGNIIPTDNDKFADSLCEAIEASRLRMDPDPNLRDEICSRYSVKRLANNMDKCYKTLLNSRGLLKNSAPNSLGER